MCIAEPIEGSSYYNDTYFDLEMDLKDYAPQNSAISELLRRSDMFSGIDLEILDQLMPTPELITVPGGESILVQGDPGEYFYLLVHGRLGVSVEDEDGVPRMVATVQSGEGVGEMSLLSDRAVSATVATLRDSDIVRFSKATFDNLIAKSPEAALNITRNIISRLEKTLHGVKSVQDLSTIVVCATTANVDHAAFAENLSGALKSMGSVAVIQKQSIDAREFGRYLHTLEDENDHVILVCDHVDDEWQKLCIRQGDKLLLVGNVDDQLEDLNLATYLDPTKTDLVLLYKQEVEGEYSTSWRRAYNFKDIYHIRKQQGQDHRRLARILTGRANNLILSGGAAHSFAQIGVIKALEEAGIPIDRVCGTSMGSLIAAQYSLGMGFDEMLAENRRIWADGKPLSDLTFPTTALIRGKRLQSLIYNSLGDKEIEDMPIPFSCVSTNLTRARHEFHQTGSLWRAVRASGTIPGIGPPMISHGELLVDGGILSNLPVELFQLHYGGNVIAVDVGLRDMDPVGEEWNDSVASGWSLLWRQLNPFNKSEILPSIIAILYRTATLGSESGEDEAKNADLYISLNLEEHNALDFGKIDVISAAAYDYAKQWLPTQDLSNLSRDDVITRA